MIPDRETLLDVMQRVVEKDKAYREEMSEMLSGAPFGHKRLNDEEWMAWFSGWVAKNPWRLTWLPVIENGPEALRRYSRITGVEDAYGYLYGGLVAPMVAAPPSLQTGATANGVVSQGLANPLGVGQGVPGGATAAGVPLAAPPPGALPPQIGA